MRRERGGDGGRSVAAVAAAAFFFSAPRRRRHERVQLSLLGQQVRVVAHRPAHGLARVVDDDVQPRQRLVEHRAERLEAPHVAQVDGVHVQPLLPNLKVVLRGVPPVRVRGEARGGQQRGAGSEELEPYFEADLDPGAGQKRNLAGQVRGQTAHLPVHRRARFAKLRVEVVQLREPSLARVALPRRVQGTGRTSVAVVVQVVRVVRFLQITARERR